MGPSLAQGGGAEKNDVTKFARHRPQAAGVGRTTASDVICLYLCRCQPNAKYGQVHARELALEKSMIIDRRNLLTSLAATTACTPLGSTANAADTLARRGGIRERGDSCEGWFLAIEPRPQMANCTVDFWARPFTDIEYTQYLPPEITRCAMWYAYDNPNRPRPTLVR